MIVSTLEVKPQDVPLLNMNDRECAQVLMERLALELARLYQSPDPIERDHWRRICRQFANRRGVLFVTFHIEQGDDRLENGKKGGGACRSASR